MVKLTAKATDVDTVKDKKKKGADSIEWQILKDNIEVDPTVFSVLPITSVHTALWKGEDIAFDVCFPTDYFPKEKIQISRAKFEEALSLADFCGQYQGFPVKTVVHLHNRILGLSYSEIANQIQKWLHKYPNVEITVENNLFMNRYGEIQTACDPSDTPDFVQEIRKRLPEQERERVGTVLDTCHVLGTCRMKRLLWESNDLKVPKSELKQLEEYFKENSGICKIVHCNNAAGYGLTGKNHGTVFQTKEDEKILDYILYCYQKYTKKADFVIEIREEDYLNSVNFLYTVEQIKKRLKR